MSKTPHTLLSGKPTINEALAIEMMAIDDRPLHERAVPEDDPEALKREMKYANDVLLPKARLNLAMRRRK